MPGLGVVRRLSFSDSHQALRSRLVQRGSFARRGWCSSIVLVPTARRLSEKLDLRLIQKPEFATASAGHLALFDELAQPLSAVAQFFGGNRQQDQPVLRAHESSVFGVTHIVPRDSCYYTKLLVESNHSVGVMPN